MITIRELAKECGMSVSAVSKAMNNKKGISPENAEMVRKKAQELGYFPNAAARTMRTNKSHNIGIMFRNDMAHEYFSLVLEAIRCRASELDYDITFLERGDMSFLEHAKNRQCDGIIIAAGDFEPEQLKMLADSDMPLVGIDHSFENCSSVYGSNEESMKEIVNYLYGLGHRKIAFFYGEVGEVTLQRLSGFTKGMRSCGLETPREFVMQTGFGNLKAAGNATRELLSADNRPTCILYPDDISVLGGISAIQEMGLKIPEDVCVFGYDGIRLTNMLTPTIATYHQDAKGIGEAAVNQLVAEIEESAQTRMILVPGKIQEGGTVRKLTE